MTKTTCLLFLQFFALIIAVNGVPETTDDTPDFFSRTADHITEMLRKQLMSTFANEDSSRNKRAEESEGQEGNEESFPRPEFHHSTLRAQASGSGIPSPTMFVGGFSFMMMPTPEGEQIFNRIMEALPPLPNSSGKK